MDDYLKNIESLRKRKKKYTSSNNLQEVSRICRRMGEILHHLGRYDEALIEYEAEEAACAVTNDDLGVAVANRKIGECYAELGNFHKALDHQMKHLDMARDLNNDVEEQRALATIGRTYLLKAEALGGSLKRKLATDSETIYEQALKNAEEYFRSSLDVCERLPLENVGKVELAQMKARLYQNLGIVLDYRNNLDDCVKFISQAIHLQKAYNQNEDLQRCLHSLALIYQKHAKFADCLQKTKESLEVAKKLNDVALQIEVLILTSQVKLQQHNFLDGKKTLKEAKKLASGGDTDDMYKVNSLLKTAAKLVECQENLLIIDENDASGKKALYEKMGDLFCKASLNKNAIRCYEASLKCAKTLDLVVTELAPLYSSLAQTYADEGQYEKAVSNYQKELECWNGRNAKEQCKTLLNLAECEEFLEANGSKIAELYSKALTQARSCSNRKLERQCLESLSSIQKSQGQWQKHKTTKAQLEQLCELSDEEHESDCESESSAFVSDSSDDGDDEEKDSEIPNQKSQKICCPRTHKTFRMRRNEKGETPLHRMCIAGNFKQVKKLLEQGHPVNIRDYSGWLPLHEAANHGFAEIVELLLKHNARIDDRGGDHCDGVTPLHDAAVNGHLDVVKTLLNHGASVIVKTNQGDTVLSCLRNWREKDKDEISASKLTECLELESEIERMTESKVTDGSGTKAVKSTEKKRKSDEVFRNNDCTDANTALVSDEIVLPDCDDWLIDDIGDIPQQRRNKRRRCDLTSWIERDTEKRNNQQKSANSVPRMRGSLSDVSNVIVQSENCRKRLRSNSGDDVEEVSLGDIVRVDDGTSSPWSPENSHLPEFSQQSVPNVASLGQTSFSGLRVKVKVMDKLLLIPVPSGETVAWLTAQASQRYYALSGLRPKLTLATKDGAILSLDDSVDFVISSGEELVGQIESWDLLPVSERYVDACKIAQTAPRVDVEQILKQSEYSLVASLANMKLGSTSVQPILRTLQSQNTLLELNLSGNRFGKDELKILAHSLQHLPTLRLLDLSSNDITDSVLGYLAAPLQDTKEPLMVETLKLGFNPLLEEGCANLAKLLSSFGKLISICLPSISIEPDAVHPAPNLSDALLVVATSIQYLDLSFTQLSPEQLTAIITEVVPVAENLRRLNLTAVTGTSIRLALRMCKNLASLMSKSPCNYSDLNLSFCCLNDECIECILRAPVATDRYLERLDLTGNIALTDAKVEQIVDHWSVRDIIGRDSE